LVAGADTAYVSRIARSLWQNRYLVVVAHDTDTAVRSTEKRRPDAIVLELPLPGENGAVFYRWLKSHSSFSEIPVVAITGPSSERADSRAFFCARVEGQRIPPPERFLGRSADESALLEAVDGAINPQISILQ
jgi:CheY-like chemotaxis protein